MSCPIRASLPAAAIATIFFAAAPAAMSQNQFASRQFTVNGTAPQLTIPTDLDANGTLDLIIPNKNSFFVATMLNPGNGSFLPGPNAALPSGAVTVAVYADVTQDGIPDIITAGANIINVCIGLGGGTFATGTPTAIGGAMASIVIGNFNGDAFPDVVAALLG